MILRRLAALSTALLLLRLTVVAVDVTCAEHEVGDAATSEQSVAHDHDASAHVDGESAANPSESCDLPVRSDCCQALALCSIALDFGALTGAEATPPDEAERLTLGLNDPASRSDAPDPPPPKA